MLWRLAPLVAALVAGGALLSPAGPAAVASRPSAEGLAAVPLAAPSRGSSPIGPPAGAGSAGSVARRCPWLVAAARRHDSPAELARLVVARMDTTEKLDVVGLYFGSGYENRNAGVPSLCIPPLTLEDGPAGLSAGDTGVTQLPAPLGVAASFDTGLAYDYGRVEGTEARAQGIDAVQGPNLNIDRVPYAGRAFEGYGEDPRLVASMGVADVEGIQSAGVMSDAKHFGVYTQETDRRFLDQVVGRRALEEIYLAPFRAVVERAHVASLMCSYGRIDGVVTCGDRLLFDNLYRDWHFQGFVRSDLAALLSPAEAPGAFAAGLDMVKPRATDELADAVARDPRVGADLDRAVRQVLREMFAFHLVLHPLSGHPGLRVDSSAHARFARRAAEESMVLLKDAGGVLPLRPARSSASECALAVIGRDAAGSAQTAGYGSARVVAPFVSTPLAALRRALGRKSSVRYAGGMTGAVELPAPSLRELPGATSTGPVAPPLLAPRHGRAARLAVLDHLLASGAASTGPIPGADLRALAHWDVQLLVPHTGLYSLSVTDNGDTWVSLGRDTLLAQPGEASRAPWTVAVELRRGVRYPLEVTWFPFRGHLPPKVGLSYDTPAITRAVALARSCRTAIVFASDRSGEGSDRPTLELPGDENALIAAVARTNRRTVVVLNTGGPVLMPWLSRVAAVLEAWYPGEEDGAATAAVLFGRYDPAGRLPVTFPRSAAATPVSSPSQWPGVDGTVRLSGGLEVGYRWYAAHHVQPLFPFGYGLDYTSFSLGPLSVSSSRHGVVARVEVRNTGKRAGTEVVECYLGHPKAAGEPPIELAAFGRIWLPPARAGVVDLRLSRSAFAVYHRGRFVVVRGRYELFVGTSAASLPLVASFLAPASWS